MAKGGFGGGGWGGGWGGGSGPVSPQVVVELLGVTESLFVLLPLEVRAAVPLTPFLVRIDFSHDLDVSGSIPTVDVSNYTISGLAVTDVAPGPNTNSVTIRTAEQQAQNYTVTVAAARSFPGDPIDPLNNSAAFPGFPIAPSFFATAQSPTKVQLTFSTEVLQNAALTDPASYTITTIQGTSITIDSVVTTGPTPITRVSLELGDNLNDGGFHIATIDTSPGQIEAANGFPFINTTDLFQWARQFRGEGAIRIPASTFSGEVTSGLLGQPAGQIFFSPALEVAAANSSIQIDECAVCTTAFDVYEIPELPDPNILTTFGAYIGTTLNDTDSVLFAPAPRLGLSEINLTDNQAETMPQAVDGPADAELQETFDPAKVSLLNVSDEVLFDGVNPSFILADNLAPIGPGATTNINLQP